MTAATSSKSRNFFGIRYKNNISSNKKILIVNIVMQVLGLPVLAAVMLVACYADKISHKVTLTHSDNALIETLENVCMTFLVIAIIALSISALMGMVIALFQYKYLYKKTLTDMNYSLPLSGTQRFFADYLSGITIYLAPLFGGFILAVIILGIGTPFFDKMSEFWKYFPDILRYFGIVVIIMTQFYTLTVLAISFCGNTFETIFTSLSLNIMIPTTIGCIWAAVVTSSAYGISGEEIFTNGFFSNTTPIGSVIFFFASLEMGNYYDDGATMNDAMISLVARWMTMTLIVTAIYVAISWFICRIRKAEDVSKPYVYRAFFYLIMTMCVYCILSLFIILEVFIVGGIVICAIGWFIMEVITRRGFKKFWQAGIAFTLSVCSVLCISKICSATDGFGMSKKVPSPSIVRSVGITISVDSFNLYNVDFRERDVINEAVTLNEELVNRYFNYSDYEYNVNQNGYYDINADIHIDFNYTTYTGSNIMRTYKLPSGLAADLLKKIMLSDEYADNQARSLENRMEDVMSNDDIRYRIDLNDRFYNYICEETISEETAHALAEAYRNDLRSMTEDELDNAKIYGYIYNMNVFDTFDETINVLKSINMEITDQPFEEKRIGFIESPIFYSDAGNYFNPDEHKGNNKFSKYSNCTGIYEITQITMRSHSIDNVEYVRSVSDKDKDKTLNELLNRCTSVVFGEKPIAIVVINEKRYFLLDKGDNKELLESISQHKNYRDELEKEYT